MSLSALAIALSIESRDGSDRRGQTGNDETVGVTNRRILIRFKGSSQHCFVESSVGDC